MDLEALDDAFEDCFEACEDADAGEVAADAGEDCFEAFEDAEAGEVAAAASEAAVPEAAAAAEAAEPEAAAASAVVPVVVVKDTSHGLQLRQNVVLRTDLCFTTSKQEDAHAEKHHRSESKGQSNRKHKHMIALHHCINLHACGSTGGVAERALQPHI